MDINKSINKEVAKKIFGNQNNAKEYLLELYKFTKTKDFPVKKIKTGKNKDRIILKIEKRKIWEYIIKYWDYKISKDIIRKLFKKSVKYKNGTNAYKLMTLLIKEWKNKNFGELSWPFSQGAFDNFVQSINSLKISRSKKDNQVKLAALKYRRIKEINTIRNDFIETLIFEKNNNIVPTLSHSRGVDFFINGVSFDQKVSKSPTNEFKKKYGNDWKKTAINNPSLVAKFLYKYQDEGRFGADNRLLIVYLDENITIERINNIIANTNLDKPIKIKFDYHHKTEKKKKNYVANCFLILLYNQ